MKKDSVFFYVFIIVQSKKSIKFEPMKMICPLPLCEFFVPMFNPVQLFCWDRKLEKTPSK